MVLGALMKVAAAARGPRGRRYVAVFCAVALLLVGFVHNLRHSVDVPSATLAWQASSVDDAGDSSSKHESAVVEHCHGCTMVAAMTSVESTAPLFIAAAPAYTPALSVHPHQPSADTPPPRTAN